jgi:cytochrome c heme-lyase
MKVRNLKEHRCCTITMGQTASSSSSPALEPPSSCPMHQKPSAASSGCPIQHDPPAKSDPPAQCPIDHGQNPLNQMPTLAQTPSPNQSTALPLTRTESSIPRDPSTKWEYPSPQQFYNALVRKGWETPEEHVETMVEIHNFLNEEAWQEVLKWEKRSNR